MWGYRAYGLRVASNQPLMGLPRLDATDEIDLRVEFLPGPPGPASESPPLLDQRSAINRPDAISTGLAVWAAVSPGDPAMRLRFYGGGEECEATIDAAGTAIQVAGTRHFWPAETYLADHTAVLMGSVLSCALRLRGRLCLHGSAVVVAGRAVILLGAKGAGKSTSAAALMDRGCPLVADDAAVIDERGDGYVIHPGPARLRLWASALPAVRHRIGDPSALARVLSPNDKYYVDLSDTSADGAWCARQTPEPIAAVYVLTRPANATRTVVSPISGSARLTTLLAHTSVRFVPLTSEQRSREFARLRRFASIVPVRHVECASGFDRLDELADALIADTRYVAV